MKVTLYNAISTDGFIAKLDKSTDWVDDEEEYFKEARKVGAVITGRKTFDPGGEEYTVPDCTNYVYTSSPETYTSSSDKVIFVGGTPQEVLERVAKDGFEEVLLVGGGQINGTFAKARLINEVLLDIHHLLLGNGIRLFGDAEIELKLELVRAEPLKGNIIQNYYKVVS